MKRLLITLIISLMLCVSCAGKIPAVDMYSQYGVFLDPTYGWFNIIGHSGSGIKSLTLRVINTKYVDSSVLVECIYGRSLFGSKKVYVKSRSAKVFTIMGMPRGSGLKCSLKEVK